MYDVIVTGNLVRDPQVSNTNNGNLQLRFTIGARLRAKGDDGNTKSEFLDFTIFGKQAEFAQQRLHKGSRILVHAAKYDTVVNTGNDGRTYVNQSFNVNSIEYLDPVAQNAGQQPQYQQNMSQPPVQQYQQPPSFQQVAQAAPSSQMQPQQPLPPSFGMTAQATPPPQQDPFKGLF